MTAGLWTPDIDRLNHNRNKAVPIYMRRGLEVTSRNFERHKNTIFTYRVENALRLSQL